MCTEEQHKEKIQWLRLVHAELVSMNEALNPIDRTNVISPSQPFIVDYKDRRHLFIYSGSALTLQCEDYGAFALSANTWTNFPFPQGMRVTPNTAGTILTRATNEIVP